MTLAGGPFKLLAQVLAEEKHFSAAARMRERGADAVPHLDAERTLMFCRKVSTEQLIEGLQRAEDDLIARLVAFPKVEPRARQGGFRSASSGHSASRYRRNRCTGESHHLRPTRPIP